MFKRMRCFNCGGKMRRAKKCKDYIETYMDCNILYEYMLLEQYGIGYVCKKCGRMVGFDKITYKKDIKQYKLKYKDFIKFKKSVGKLIDKYGMNYNFTN